MTIKVKKEVEETIEVAPPFATKTDNRWYYIVEENEITMFTDNFLTKKKKESYGFENSVREALAGTHVSMDEAYGKFSEVVESFQLQLA